MAETTRTRKTRVEERTTIEIDGDELVGLVIRAPEFMLDSRYAIEVTIDDGCNEIITLDGHVTVRVTQVVVSRDDVETVAPVDPTDLAQQRGFGLGVRPPGVHRQPRRNRGADLDAPPSLPESGDGALGQDKG